MASDPGVLLIFVTTICLVAALADLVVSGLDRPAWAVAPAGDPVRRAGAGPGLRLRGAELRLPGPGLPRRAGRRRAQPGRRLEPRAERRHRTERVVPPRDLRAAVGLLRRPGGVAVGRAAGRARRGARARPRRAPAHDQPAGPRAGQRLRRQRSAPADRPQPRPEAQPQPADRPGRVPLHDQPAGRGVPADGRAAAVLRRRVRQHRDPAQHGHQPVRAARLHRPGAARSATPGSPRSTSPRSTCPPRTPPAASPRPGTGATTASR